MKKQDNPLETNPVLRQDPFAAPHGYFDDLANQVQARMAGADPHLQRLAQPSLRKEVFTVPAGYWDWLPARMQERIVLLRGRTQRLWPQLALHYAMPTLATLLIILIGYLNIPQAPSQDLDLQQEIMAELGEGMDAFDPTDTALLADQLANLQQTPDMQWRETTASYLLNNAEMDLILEQYQ